MQRDTQALYARDGTCAAGSYSPTLLRLPVHRLMYHAGDRGLNSRFSEQTIDRGDPLFGHDPVMPGATKGQGIRTSRR